MPISPRVSSARERSLGAMRLKANISTSDVGAEGEVAVEDDVPAVEGGDNVVTLEGAGAPGDEAVWAESYCYLGNYLMPTWAVQFKIGHVL